MTTTSTDPGAIDLEKYRTGGASNLALIAAVEALRERVAKLAGALEDLRVAWQALNDALTKLDALSKE